MIAFVLVLETVDLLPKIYGAEKVNELFSSEKVPGEVTFRKEKRKELMTHYISSLEGDR